MTNCKAMAAEAILWNDHLQVLQAGLDQGKPDGLQRIKGEIERLDREISALSVRRELAGIPEARAGQLQIEIEVKAARVQQLAGLLKQVKIGPRDLDEGATPEVAARPSRRDSVLTLELNGALSPEQARAARTIARVFEAIARAGQARTGRLDTAGRSSSGYREPEMPYELDALRGAVYIPWANQLSEHGAIALDLAIKVAVYGHPLGTVRRRHRIGWDNALGKLRDALDLFDKLERDHRRECERETEGATS